MKDFEAVLLWEDTVGDSGVAPTDNELATFAFAVENQVRAQIAADIEAVALGYSPLSHDRGVFSAAARMALGDA